MEDEKKPFEFYYNKYYSQVYGYILKKIGNPEQSEDIAMDVFFSCYQKFEAFDVRRASFATWIYTITNNKLKNYYRSRKIAEELDESFSYQESFEDDIAEAIYLSEMKKILEHAMMTLNAQEQLLIKLKYYKNENSSSISAKTGMSPVNVRVHLHRAIKKLKKYFEANNVKWEL